MNKIVILVLVAMCTNLFAVSIKLGSLAPQNSPWDNALQKLSSEWSKISGGQVQLKIYPGGIAGDEKDMLRKMKTNLLGGSALTGLGMNDLYPGILAAQLPMMYESDAEFNYVFNKMKPMFEKELEKRGAKVIIWTQVGWIRFFTKNAMTRPMDMKKEKMFVYAGEARSVQVWREAGFNPVPLSTNDVMTSLQSGMVTSFATTPLSAAALQWFGLAKNMADMKWAPLMGGVIISTSVWNKITPDMQKKLIASANQIGKSMQGEINKADNDAIAIMKENGLKVNAVPREQYGEWRKIADTAIKSVMGTQVDPVAYKMVQKHIADYRALNKGK